uniref:Uncharacterized protein n=1 Tax=Lotus japonicus TaxID=34305 RepID=I3T9U2_LOTJA|nr:unknown [Lotus japonicus]
MIKFQSLLSNSDYGFLLQCLMRYQHQPLLHFLVSV